MILILTEADDGHAPPVERALERRGAGVLRFETDGFPRRSSLTLRSDPEGFRLKLTLDGREVDLSEVRTVWYRRPKNPVAAPELDADDREFAAAESRHLLRSLWHLLADRFWVNGYEAGQRAEHKPLQLRFARDLGFEIPRTLITRDPEELEPFVRACGGDVIYKPLTPCVRRDASGTLRSVYTNRLDMADLRRAGDISFAPCLFQEYVPKRVEIRATVIGGAVHAAEIHSQDSDRARDDWRRYDLGNTPHGPHRLPADVERRCLDLVRRMGLVFGCIDLILTPDGRYVFLEINPNGQWLWVEELAGLPLLDAFVGLLLEGGSGRPPSRD